MDLKAFKTIKYFFINGTKKQNRILVEVGFIGGFLGGSTQKTNWVFWGMYSDV